MCSRLILHLYEVATPASSFSEHYLESMSAINFTTRIELELEFGTSIDDRSDMESAESSR